MVFNVDDPVQCSFSSLLNLYCTKIVPNPGANIIWASVPSLGVYIYLVWCVGMFFSIVKEKNSGHR